MTNGGCQSADIQRIRELEARLEELERETKRLKAGEEKYRLLVEHANDAIFILQDGKIAFANPKALEMGALPGEDAGKINYVDMLHPEDRDRVRERHEKRLLGEKVLNMYPLRIVNRNGETFWAEVNAVRIQWDQRPATLNIIRDITTQKLMENQYLQLESLETLRTLSGGLAHSFNNLLMGIQGRISLLFQTGNEKDINHHHLKGIEACVHEAAKLTRQMLGFAQSGKFRVTRVDMGRLVDGVLRSLNREKRPVSFETQVAADLRRVEGDARQLEQVVTNVLLNAWQAIPYEGRVVVRVENFDMNEARPEFESLVSGLSAGSWIRLCVRDNGIGMDPSVRKRVFEPFFTTKGMGLHRGLGLSSAYGIVANHGGVIDIDSTPGYGTTISVYLPAAEGGGR